VTNFLTVLRAVATPVEVAGRFDRVVLGEPKSAPGTGMSAAVFVSDLYTVPARSGLASVSVRLEVCVRVMLGMLTEPQEAIEPAILTAVEDVWTLMFSDIDLGSEVAVIDILGMYGERIRARWGYITLDSTMYRIADVFIPVILPNEITEAN
jgi:hypothetical protein